jgi:hypothetical protein
MGILIHDVSTAADGKTSPIIFDIALIISQLIVLVHFKLKYNCSGYRMGTKPSRNWVGLKLVSHLFTLRPIKLQKDGSNNLFCRPKNPVRTTHPTSIGGIVPNRKSCYDVFYSILIEANGQKFVGGSRNDDQAKVNLRGKDGV